MSAKRFVMIGVALATACSAAKAPETISRTVVLAGPDAYYQVTLDLPPDTQLESPLLPSAPAPRTDFQRPVVGTSVQWLGLDIAIELLVLDPLEKRECNGVGSDVRIAVEGGYMTLCGFDTGAIRIVRSWRSADVDIVCRPVDRLRTDLMRVFAACSGMRVAREKVTAEPTQHLWIPLLDGTVKQLNVEIDVPRHHAFVYPYLNDWRNAWVLGFHGPMVRIELLSGEPPVVLMDCPSDIRRRAAVGNGTHECWDDEFFQIERYVWIKGRMVQCTIVDRLGTYRDERDYLRMMCASMRIVAAR